MPNHFIVKRQYLKVNVIILLNLWRAVVAAIFSLIADFSLKIDLGRENKLLIALALSLFEWIYDICKLNQVTRTDLLKISKYTNLLLRICSPNTMLKNKHISCHG